MTVIFGGTGSLGKALVDHIYDKVSSIHVVSRCEIRQAEMREKYPRCIYHLGDVTNPFSLPYIKAPGNVFNLAAMKHVDLGEENFEYCINVNFQGVVNTYSWAFEHEARSFSQSSTDKAVEPWNAYGAAKMLGEKYLYSRKDKKFPVSVFSWANVIGSRGSVVQKFVDNLVQENCIKITDPAMTRMWVELKDVARFMWEKREVDSGKTPHIPPMKSASVMELALAVADVCQAKNFDIVTTGIRPGEKIHETMIARHDMRMQSDTCPKYTHKELCAMVERTLSNV